MPINPSIALGVQPMQLPMQDPGAGMNALAKAMQIRGMQQEGDVNALRMQEMQRGVQEENALRALYGSPDFSWNDPAKRAAAFAASPTKAQGHYKAFVDSEKDRFTMAEKGYGIFQKAIGAHAANPNASKQGVLSTIQGLVQMGVMNPTVAGNIAQAIPDDPQQLRGFLRDALSSQMSGEQVLTAFAPKPEKMDNGQQVSFRDTNPNSPTYGRATAGDAVQKVATPDAVLSADTSTANNKRSVGASLANAAATRDVAQATRDAANIQTGFQNEQKLRQEFEGLPEVKNYKQAYPAYAAIRDAASRNTTQSDINIVYGLAKLYDPNSVVREGEYATVANSPNIPERIKGYAQYLQGGGKLSPETKRQILAEAQGRIGTYEIEARKARGSYEQIARTRGMNPAGVFADMGDMTVGASPTSAAVRGAATRESSGKVQNGPSVFDQADAILNGGKGAKR